MGREMIWHKPGTIEALEGCPEACQVFKDAGWFEFFQKLEGPNNVVAMEFMKNQEGN